MVAKKSVKKKAAAKRKAAGVAKPSSPAAPAKAPSAIVVANDSDEEPETSTSAAEDSGVVYIGRIPHGFYEPQLKGFFSQFGDVKRWRVSRSKRNAKSKGYAFVQFTHPEVARIAAEAMDGYLMFKQALKCHVMKVSDVHPEMFTERNKKMKEIPWRKLEMARQDKERTSEQAERRMQRAVRRDQLRKERINKAGIEYEYQGLEAQIPSKPVHKKF
mmetsp:Transcript_19548/g.54370  ORF Transcript_19548/g.54370 Transcript_19548/m.54370 type:complete len:216 (-) Transcript_19548:50-697(-)|eukprot:CAMPEP_0117657374 /NCGR_PEP_ID=MMETSP0804-20121206/5295_1 /TAXON_ID=1074897 /ORGANISM="Tetraselmis astigmatica, Strain CCMP880" /LENGTH=215 /DNA_ID=CAMNT_0005463821 /DNA_START=30 /DNA_END=677 /DNA_ORIENTATION=+